MEFEEAHNNLRAIRLLYRLLHDNNLCLQNEYSEDLIERARGLLKNLLDVAVVSVFQTHLKIIAAQAGVSKASFDQEKHMAVLQSNSPVAANNSQSSVEYPTLSKMTSQKDEHRQLRLISEKELPGSISDNGGTNSLGEENIMKQHNLVKATALPNGDGISPNNEQHNNVDTLDGVGMHAKESPQMFETKVGESSEDNSIPMLSRIHEFQYNSSVARHVESPDQKGDFSDDLLNAMKRIESRMFALQLCSNLADSTKNSADHQNMLKVANLDSANMQRKDETPGSQNHRLHTNAVSAKSNDASKQIGIKLVSGGEEMRSQNRIQGLNRVKSLNRLVSGNTNLRSQASNHIQDLRVPLNQDDLANKPSKLSGHTNRKSLVRKNPAAWSETDPNQKKSSPEHSYTQRPVRSTASTIARRRKTPPHQMVIRPTLLDQRSSEIKVFSHQHRDGSILDRRGTHENGQVEPWKTRVHPQDHEFEESSSSYHSSSSWTSQQGSGNSSSSDSEDYSLPGSNSHSPTSGTMVDAAYEGSSEESTNSYTSNDDNPSHGFGSLKSYRHYQKRNPDKTIGVLRRLKNKLGLIFHHHHHHHHHYHYDDDDDDDDDNGSIHSKKGPKHSMWNNLQNVFHQKNKHGVLTKGKVENKKRRGGAVARVVPRGNQVGQFHRLVEGLLRHMRHSKKQKTHKHGGVKGSRNTPHGHSKKKKKLHWWQMLQQRRGVKMKNKGRVKMGFISQNHQKKST